MNFHVINLGCRVNRVESDMFAARCMAQGGVLSALSQADVVIVNTCTVTGEAEKKTRKAVRHALRENESARVVVTGCAAAIDADTYTQMSDRIEVRGKGELAASGPLRIGDAFPTRVGVKIQDGCDNACTYCIVHVARGRSVSRSVDEVVDECCAYAAAGVKEIVLTGINLGTFDGESEKENRRFDLSDLLETLLEQTASYNEGSPCRFRISSIEPKNVSDRLIGLIASSEGRVCRHLHLPLQSGSSKVLREMARPYNADDFAALTAKLYESIPEMSLSTDIIVGFPGETADDFESTLEMAKRCRFSKIHVFPYSMRAGTPAAVRRDQIDPQEKTRRASVLRNLSDELREQERALRRGKRELVLVEEGGRGTSESYFEVDVPALCEAGCLVELEL